MKEIILKAMGQAISKTVAIAEIIKVGLSCLIILALSFPLFLMSDLCCKTEKDAPLVSRYCH